MGKTSVLSVSSPIREVSQDQIRTALQGGQRTGFRKFARSLWYELLQKEAALSKRDQPPAGTDKKPNETRHLGPPTPVLYPKRIALSKAKSLENLANVRVMGPKLLGGVVAPTGRGVVLKDVPLGAGLAGILSHIRGGALERVVFREHPAPTLEATFIEAKLARCFFEYASQTGFLSVNGHRVLAESMDLSNTASLDYMQPLVPYLEKEYLRGARRVLILARPVHDKPEREGPIMHYPSARLHLLKDVDVEQIRRDFAKYGDVVEVTPVVSRKLCFSIHYTDIRLAIVAKQDVRSEGSIMGAKYHAWTVSYGKDPADAPCYVL